MVVKIREPIPFNETENARRHREAVEQYLRHSRAEQQARADAPDITVVILQTLEELLRERAAAKAGDGQ